MAGVHYSSSSSLKAFSVSFFLLFCAAHLLLHVSSNVAVEFSMDLNHRDSPLRDPNVGYSFDVKLKFSSFVVTKNAIGSRMKVFDAIISTASNLNWLLCIPCDCHFTFGPKYQSYSSESWIDGVLSEDKLRLQSTRGEFHALDDFTFGCIHTTGGSFSKEGIGYMALGRSSYSFAAQMGRKLGSMKFSYCLPISPTAVGWLRFGSAAGVSGPEVVTTPLVDDNSNLYKARLESIRVQGSESDSIPIGDNIVIDSATQASYIHPLALKVEIIE